MFYFEKRAYHIHPLHKFEKDHTVRQAMHYDLKRRSYENVIINTSFSDEAIFHIRGHVNGHYCQI